MINTIKYISLLLLLTLSISCEALTDGLNLSNDKKLSIKQEFHEPGKLAVETSYDAQGKKHGPHKEWFPNGKIQVEKMYEHDELIAHKLYTPKGKILQNIVYKEGRKYGLLYSSFCMNGVAKSGKKDSLIFKPKN